MLTPAQHQCLMFIDRYSREHGGSPSYSEIATELHLKAKSGVNRLLKGLIERGFIERRHYQARALTVLKLPPGQGAPTAGELGMAADIITRGLAHDASATEGDGWLRWSDQSRGWLIGAGRVLAETEARLSAGAPDLAA